MSKIVSKIYKIDSAHLQTINPKNLIQVIIEKQNSDKKNNQYQQVECVVDSGDFDLTLFIHKPKKSFPSWRALLLEITEFNSEVKTIESKYPSFIMFFSNSEEIFVVTGGGGFRAVDEYFDTQFGFKVVERLINTNSDDLRSVQQRVFLGAELASNRFFKADYSFKDEDTFGKYYRGLDVFINTDKLESIGVASSKKKLLVRGELGFKIDTKISFEELLERVHKISALLKEECKIELNPFKRLTRAELNRKVSRNSTLGETLDLRLIEEQFTDFVKADVKEIYHPNLIEFLNCSTIRVKYEKEEVDIPTSQKITPRLVFGYLQLLDSVQYLPRFKELVNKIEIWIVNEETDQKMYHTTLADWFYGEIKENGVNYMKFENEWFHYSLEFSNNLNNRINAISSKIEIEAMHDWTSEISDEGAYNDNFAGKGNFIIGDGVFHKGIEVADIISWNEKELIVYHVKKHINKDLRVLQSQIINSAKVVSEWQTNLESMDFKAYHQRLVTANNKLSNTIPDLMEFTAIFEKEPKFVFAMATTKRNVLKSEIFSEITNSSSAVAKIAFLHSYYTIRSLGHQFSIAKIIRHD